MSIPTNEAAKPPSEPRPAELPSAIEFDMTSKINGRTYRIFVSAPFAPPSEGGYPLIIFTDGNMTFPLAAAMGGTMFGLLGGKPSVSRTRDLTPPTPLDAIPSQPGLPPPAPENYGGADDFLRFLIEELKPALAAAYPISADDHTLYG